MARRLADAYGRRLDHEAMHLVVQHDLLPHLWVAGHLGGRTFDVLMTELPMREIQKRLDGAYGLHPESTTLADFRADEEIVAAEDEALKRARHIITPHTAIARLFRERARLIPWSMPAPKPRASRRPVRTILFPASTVARKGCYELRDAMRGMDVKLLTMGPTIEADNFWDGFAVRPAGVDGLQTADVVVLPAFIEHRPRRLLQAVASGVPVIATASCGVENVEGVSIIPEGDANALRAALSSVLS